MLNANAESLSKKGFAAPDRSPARVILWVLNVQSVVDHFPTTCCSPHTKRRIKLNNKVRPLPSFRPHYILITQPTEAAIDANAPLEDEDAALGPIDSDEELTTVMHGLSTWNPVPLVPPLIQMPIDREYQKKRLYEQLHNATNGFTMNICKVVGYGAQKLPEGHRGLEEGEADAEGDITAGGFGSAGIMSAGGMGRRTSGFNMQLPASRRASVVSQR